MTTEQHVTLGPTSFVFEAGDEKSPTRRYVALYEIPHSGHVITQMAAARPFTQGYIVLSGVKSDVRIRPVSSQGTQEVWADAPLFRNFFSNCAVILRYETEAADAAPGDHVLHLVSDLWPDEYAAEFHKPRTSFLFVYNPSIGTVIAYPRDGKNPPKPFLPGCFAGTEIFQAGAKSGLLRWWENPVISQVPPTGTV